MNYNFQKKHIYQYTMTFLVLFVAAFALTAQAQENQIEQSNYSLGVEAYQKGEFRRAFEAWSLDSYEGNAKAQYNLGVLYLEGRGVEQNIEQARAWFLKAAEKDQLEAQHNLGH
ncbi:MAG: sel1 repeat family protein, partial [Gammaproteobacteria bacterium]|nr:sel1 repeat family protein [Gammaproteobacteria bacterium]